jgi:hypothetical protein
VNAFSLTRSTHTTTPDLPDPTGKYIMAEYSANVFVIQTAANVVLGGFQTITWTEPAVEAKRTR